MDLHQQAMQQGFQAALAVDWSSTNAWLGIAESELTLGRMAGEHVDPPASATLAICCRTPETAPDAAQ